MRKTKSELFTWRWLANFWGIITAIFFLIHFFDLIDLTEAIKNLAIIYISILTIFTTVKEFDRWKSPKFLSNHNGEIFIILWTVLIIIFIIASAIDSNKFNFTGEFTATYLSILGIFAISRKSRSLKRR